MADDVIALIDLTDTEYMRANDLGKRLSAKYMSRTDNQTNLMAWNAEVVERFRDELGLEVTLDLGRRLWKEVFGMESEGLLSEGPTITIEGRTEKEFDLERAVAEAQKGIADPLFDVVKRREAERAPARRAQIKKGSEEIRRQGGHPHRKEGHPHQH